jgi:hypothetical protein
MMVLIMPEGFSLGESRPMARSAKVFKKKRLAVYWKPSEKYGANVKITWEVKQFSGDLRGERDRINHEIDKSENVPDNAGVYVDMPPSPSTRSKQWRSAWANGSFYVFAFAVVIATLETVARSVPPLALGLIIIAGVLFVPLIGALQLRQDDRLSDKSFIDLVKVVVRQLPLISTLLRRARE